MSERSHNRALLWIVVLLLVVHALYALALVTVAKRVTIFYLPPRIEAAPAPAEQKPAFSFQRLSFSASSCSSFRGVVPAACSGVSVVGHRTPAGVADFARRESAC